MLVCVCLPPKKVEYTHKKRIASNRSAGCLPVTNAYARTSKKSVTVITKWNRWFFASAMPIVVVTVDDADIVAVDVVVVVSSSSGQLGPLYTVDVVAVCIASYAQYISIWRSYDSMKLWQWHYAKHQTVSLRTDTHIQHMCVHATLGYEFIHFHRGPPLKWPRPFWEALVCVFGSVSITACRRA